MTRKTEGEPSPREPGLRWLAKGPRDRVQTTLQHALQDLHKPAGTTRMSADLRDLVNGVPSSMPPGTRTDERANALWRLIQSELALIELPDERAALRAALHLDPENNAPSIDARLAHARDRGDFGRQRSGKHHGYDALRRWWSEGIRELGERVHERLDYLHDHPQDWHEYFVNGPRFRRPSPGAQPVFAELFVTTVFMKGRFVQRRITERLITAWEDDVRFYTARALPEMEDASVSVPVRALWGCKAELLPTPPGEPILTRLWFPHPLRRGESHFFASEAVARDVHTERRAINVEIDHHGIAPGARLHDSMPIRGLTIRIIFDEEEPPAAVWWYADQSERERYSRSAAERDDRCLRVSPHGHAEHTFAQACQPGADYGLSIAW
ncbi:hypothetical protein [Actinophytocola sp. KF-1]